MNAPAHNDIDLQSSPVPAANLWAGATRCLGNFKGILNGTLMEMTPQAAACHAPSLPTAYQLHAFAFPVIHNGIKE